MAHQKGFTHGGSVGKNLALLFRALLNIISFAALWFGLSQWGTEKVLFGLPASTPVLCVVIGGLLTLLLLFANLFIPYTRRSK